MPHVHLAPLHLTDALVAELGPAVREVRGRLVLSDRPTAAFAQNTWTDVQTLAAPSINAAARALRQIQRNWILHPVDHFGRAKLIEAALPPIKRKPVVFGEPAPTAPLGAWTLWDERTILYAVRTTHPFPDGEVNFVEDKTNPPSRAYLKLWEWFTLEGSRPAPGETCLDLGAAPGGWTWVLDQLGCRVISVDKAPLSTETPWSPRVEHRRESAFALEPFPVDWLFSDVICYPERLLELVRRWDGFAKRMVCTIKFQGATDFATLNEFTEIPGARVRHLYCNKHELTWGR